jgi:hypothetical protein
MPDPSKIRRRSFRMTALIGSIYLLSEILLSHPLLCKGWGTHFRACRCMGLASQGNQRMNFVHAGSFGKLRTGSSTARFALRSG